MITVVSGLPRSGTSLMMQMLNAVGLEPLTDGVRQADASNERGYFEYEPVKRLMQNSSWLGLAEGKAVKIIAVFLPHLPREFKYRIIFMERDLDSILRSQARMIARLKGSAPDGDQALLKRTFQQQVERNLAWCRKQPNIDLLRVRYEDLLADPLAVSRHVSAFTGAVDPNVMSAAVDPTLHHEQPERS